MRRVARPSKLTPERAETIVQLVRVGLTVAVAARVAGVAECTVYRWLERGRQPGRRYTRHRALLAALQQARAEREHPERWARPEDRTTTPEAPA